MRRHDARYLRVHGACSGAGARRPVPAPAASDKSLCRRASFIASRRPPAIAISTKGLNAYGGQLSWVSQLVSVKTPRAIGIRRCEDLRYAAAAIVADQADLIDLERAEDLAQHVGVGGDGNVLIWVDLGVPVCQQIHGNAPTRIGQSRQLVTPDMLVQHDAVIAKSRISLRAMLPSIGSASTRFPVRLSNIGFSGSPGRAMRRSNCIPASRLRDQPRVCS
jgi:hypothetical protein